MIRITQLKLPYDYKSRNLRKALIKKLRIPDTRLLDFMIARKSLDARDSSRLCWSFTVDVTLQNESEYLKHCRDPKIQPSPRVSYRCPESGTGILSERPVVIGSGPAGLFAAYFLAKEGYRPILIERGAPVEERIRSVNLFWENHVLDPDSNIQFGEGGAGTFSDGKLYTGVHDPSGRNGLVLQTFADHGAPKEILYSNKPHLGTDVLVRILSEMRQEIQRNGGEYRFHTTFEEFLTEEGKLKALKLSGGEILPAQVAVLAIGHSARDTFEYLIRRSPLEVAAKPFAVGVRAEHLQAEINRSQYKEAAEKWKLPPADYKLTYHAASGRSVYSFCMCPGGYVVNSSSEDGYLCINGMSYSGRSSANANSAIVVSVHPSEDPMENIRFQKDLEHKAWMAGNGRIISQRFGDFEQGIPSSGFGRILPVHKGETVMADIRSVLPAPICEDIVEAMHYFSGKIAGFDDPDTILSAVESRTSSPIRILRGEDLQSGISGIYPAGEGAGYAGGITSAAIDGIKIFEQICRSYRPFRKNL